MRCMVPFSHRAIWYLPCKLVHGDDSRNILNLVFKNLYNLARKVTSSDQKITRPSEYERLDTIIRARRTADISLLVRIMFNIVQGRHYSRLKKYTYYANERNEIAPNVKWSNFCENISFGSTFSISRGFHLLQFQREFHRFCFWNSKNFLFFFETLSFHITSPFAIMVDGNDRSIG